MQHALGQGFDPLGIIGGKPRQIIARHVRRVAGHGGSNQGKAVAPGGGTRPGLCRQGRHAVFARHAHFCSIGQIQRGHDLQGQVLRAADGAEEAQPVAQAVAFGELFEAQRALAE